jgi:hypothetical protein
MVLHRPIECTAVTGEVTAGTVPGHPPTGPRLSLLSKTNAASPIALSTKYCFPRVGLSDSIVSINFLAHKSVAAKRIAYFRCYSMGPPQVEIRFATEEGILVFTQSYDLRCVWQSPRVL